MSKIVVINLGNGCLDKGIYVTVQLRQDNKVIKQWCGSLSPCPYLVESYEEAQKVYISLYERKILKLDYIEDDLDGFEIPSVGITNVSRNQMDEQVNELKTLLNNWLNEKNFSSLEKELRSNLKTDEEILVVIETPDNQEIFQRLPWHLWDFFNTYKKAGLALSRQEFETNYSVKSDKIRILAIVGDTTNIDVNAELEFLKGLDNAECIFLIPNSPEEIFKKLGDETGWDILFFTGHSNTENNRGIMYLRDKKGKLISLSIEQLSYAFNQAKKRLKLAIFNSCDGLGLAFALGKLDIPATIVMREPIPNQVAEEFFRYFLEAFAKKYLPLHLAVRKATEKLQGLEHDFPAASLLPVLYQHSASILTWEQFMPLSWFWKQFKQMARSDQDWIKFNQFENSNLGPKFSLPSPSSRDECTIIINTPYVIEIILPHLEGYFILLHQGTYPGKDSERYLFCPSKAIAPNSRLNEHFQAMLPQKGSMMFGEGIPFDSIGQEEFIGIVLNKPLNLDWMIPSQQDPAPTWDEQRIKQLWSAIQTQNNLLIFYQSFATRQKPK